MKIDEVTFFQTLREGSIYGKLGRSLLPFQGDQRPKDKESFLQALFEDVNSGQYYPSVPRGYIIEDKHKGVSRIVPVFSYRDSCVYYFCIKQLEPAIAGNRVPGTFGGWTMSTSMKDEEEKEKEESGEGEEGHAETMTGSETYILANSLTSAKWRRNWGDFQKLAFERASRSDLGAFIKFDIANFYDSINLDLLERKIRARTGSHRDAIVDLLFVLLRNWNRQFEGYSQKTVGLPQEEIGDCSRILANFYLQDYDAFMYKTCRERYGRGEYLRYADDQIIMTQDVVTARQILFDGSKELHRIGLSVNSGKVHEFSCRDDYDYYWAFELFGLLSDPEDSDRVNEAAEMYVQQIRLDRSSVPRDWRSFSVLRRIVSVGLDKILEPTRSEIVKLLLEKDSIARFDVWMLKKISPRLSREEREDLFATIDMWIPIIPFNRFHLSVRRFYGGSVPGKDLEDLDARLKELANY